MTHDHLLGVTVILGAALVAASPWIVLIIWSIEL